MKYITFDIETTHNSETAHLWTDNGKFPPIHVHSICSIAACVTDWSDYHNMTTAHTQVWSLGECEEKVIIKEFLNLCATGTHVVSWNGLHFDVPVLKHRMLRYGLTNDFFAGVFFESEMHSFRSYKHTDVFKWLNTKDNFTSFDMACKLMGLPGKLDVNGKDVQKLFEANDFETIARYNLEDSIQLAFLWLRTLLLQTEITPQQYAVNVCTLMEAMDKQNTTAWQYIKPHIDKTILLP